MSNILDMFGLNSEQLEILYSIEHILTERDVQKNPKTAETRQKWLKQWLQTLDDSLFSSSELKVFAEPDLYDAINREAKKSRNNIWFYLVMLEATLFQAYFPLDEEKENVKAYSKLKYACDTDYLKQIAVITGLMKPEYIDRYLDTYKKTYRKVSGKSAKTIITSLSILAVTAIAAAIAAVFAGPIAVAIFGANFEIYGAALTSACLAMAGSGALAFGVGGMAGGVIAIAGGGALLGAAGSGAAAAAVLALTKNSPDFTLSQAVKLEVVLREVMLNAQHDTESAQAVIARLQNQIKNLQSELEQMQSEQEKDKASIQNLKKSIEILKRTVKDMVIFKSAFDIGMAAEG